MNTNAYQRLKECIINNINYFNKNNKKVFITYDHINSNCSNHLVEPQIFHFLNLVFEKKNKCVTIILLEQRLKNYNIPFDKGFKNLAKFLAVNLNINLLISSTFCATKYLYIDDKTCSYILLKNSEIGTSKSINEDTTNVNINTGDINRVPSLHQIEFLQLIFVS